MKSFNPLLVFVAALLMVNSAFAGNKKFNICLDSSETRTVVAHGGMEIEARCFFTAIPSLEYQPQIYFISNLPNTQTTMGFYSSPFEVLVFDYQGASCGNDLQREAMISEAGHYLSIDGQGLIMCINRGSCDCTLSGIIQKERVKLK